MLFCIGWAAVMLSLTFGIPPVWNTFILSWKVEFTASIALLILLVNGVWISRKQQTEVDISPIERNLIILPILAIILWSAITALWAPSWKSAIHHALVWSEYLIFYLYVRQLIDKYRNFSLLLSTPALTLGFYSVIAISSYLTLVIFEGGIPIGMIYSRYGEQVNTILPIIVLAVICQNGRRFKVGIALLALFWLLAFCSSSRTSIGLFLIGISATTVAIFTISSFKKWRRKMAVIVIAMIVATLPLYVFSLVASEKGTVIESRLNDEEGIKGSDDFRRLMITLSIQMIAAYPIMGVGADNFGFQVNNYRAIYGAKNPDDPALAQAENEIPERAHNEYLQITAELGFIGGALFLWLFCGIGLIAWRAFRRRRHYSPFAVAAVIGIALFFASSLVTSYSFRLIQNGFVFFFVLAVASKLTLGVASEKERKMLLSPSWAKLSYAAAIIACLGLTGYWIVRVASVAYTTSANSTSQSDDAIKKYETAIWLDDENPDARYFLALRLVNDKRYSDAIPLLKESIRIGKAPSADYSYLATAQFLDGDMQGAESSLAEAATLYPRSPFILTRYAALLEVNGKTVAAEAELKRAQRINKRAANTWWVLINNGARAASELAFSNEKDYMKVMDLQPATSMYAVVAERYIRFPEERELPFERFNGSH
ncbi:MAG TPA: O-antigen ligase family protein [Pyrinomonadaceae bacterium]|nr:O-antigen ligase family protein [Pyrinomonadaceae bacterium]